MIDEFHIYYFLCVTCNVKKCVLKLAMNEWYFDLFYRN